MLSIKAQCLLLPLAIEAFGQLLKVHSMVESEHAGCLAIPRPSPSKIARTIWQVRRKPMSLRVFDRAVCDWPSYLSHIWASILPTGKQSTLGLCFADCLSSYIDVSFLPQTIVFPAGSRHTVCQFISIHGRAPQTMSAKLATIAASPVLRPFPTCKPFSSATMCQQTARISLE